MLLNVSLCAFQVLDQYTCNVVSPSGQKRGHSLNYFKIHISVMCIPFAAIEEIPQNVVLCSKLSVLDCSSNTLLRYSSSMLTCSIIFYLHFNLSRTPEVLSALTSLTQLCMNDTAITRLPLEIGK